VGAVRWGSRRVCETARSPIRRTKNPKKDDSGCELALLSPVMGINLLLVMGGAFATSLRHIRLVGRSEEE